MVHLRGDPHRSSHRGELQRVLKKIRNYLLDLIVIKGESLQVVPDNLERFSFDYYKVPQVISNLLKNALKFTPVGGTVWISAEMYHWDRRTHQKSNINEERRSVAREQLN